jgi:hypothetical protein
MEMTQFPFRLYPVLLQVALHYRPRNPPVSFLLGYDDRSFIFGPISSLHKEGFISSYLSELPIFCNMDDDYSQCLIADGNNFQPRPGHTTVDIYENYVCIFLPDCGS